MSFRLGLTGSIGMGKTTTARFFAEAGIPVWDADAAVHRLYRGAAIAPMRAAFPEAVTDHVDRDALKRIIAADPAALTRIEAIVHPLVADDRRAFIADTDADILLLDIPLLFEKGYEAEMEATLLVTAPPDVQRERVLARPGMSGAALDAILARQMPDRDKRARATHIIETLALDATCAQVHALIDHIRSRHA
ncbi:dephospho-CoA kinase [Cereibacter sp. SYSU M97828]|nr:dephospho-CoA kinase [Cereibacter flavus]